MGYCALDCRNPRTELAWSQIEESRWLKWVGANKASSSQTQIHGEEQDVRERTILHVTRGEQTGRKTASGEIYYMRADVSCARKSRTTR